MESKENLMLYDDLKTKYQQKETELKNLVEKLCLLEKEMDENKIEEKPFTVSKTIVKHPQRLNDVEEALVLFAGKNTKIENDIKEIILGYKQAMDEIIEKMMELGQHP